MDAVSAAEQDPNVAAIVIMGAGKTFIAGADITTLERAAWGDGDAAADLHDMLSRIEDCSKPIVMAIHGTALGGGLELAMAGHYRVAASSALLGQPEVNLGIIPGAEGTQRLPRLVGIEKALDMCVTGKPMSARRGARRRPDRRGDRRRSRGRRGRVCASRCRRAPASGPASAAIDLGHRCRERAAVRRVRASWPPRSGAGKWLP